jgi:hypothetical protein
MNRRMRFAAVVAALSFAAAVIGFGSVLEGYSQRVHPVGLLGADGVPHALAFNAFGFVVPGLLAAAVAWRLRQAMAESAPWAARIGARLALLAALAFAAQGLLPLDPEDLDGAASQAHATAWTLWWISLLPCALLLAIGLRRDPAGRPLALASLALALLVACLVALPLDMLPVAIGQRVVLVAWWAWLLLAARETRS